MCLLYWLSCFSCLSLLAILWVCLFNLSLDVVHFFHLSFYCFLLCYSYVEDREWSWFIWLETHWFGNFVGDYLSLEGRAEGGTVRKDTWVATREKLRSELGFQRRPNTWGQAGPRANWSNSSCRFLFVITEFCVIFVFSSVHFVLEWENALLQFHSLAVCNSFF